VECARNVTVSIVKFLDPEVAAIAVRMGNSNVSAMSVAPKMQRDGALACSRAEENSEETTCTTETDVKQRMAIKSFL